MPSNRSAILSDAVSRQDRVAVRYRDYIGRGINGGRFVDGRTDYVEVNRSQAIAACAPYIDMADLPEYRPPGRCMSCGGTTVVGPLCPQCEHRQQRTEESLTNGGRRFGIELEFSLPSNTRDRRTTAESISDRAWELVDEGDERLIVDDGRCNCTDCRLDRARTLIRAQALTSPISTVDTSMEGIAAALTDAGVPTEVPGYTHAVTEGVWKLVTDGSVSNGYELVSPPLQWKDADQVRVAVDTLRDMGMRATTSCGLHVHHDAADFDVKHARLLARNWDRCMNQSLELVADHRHYSEWCYPARRSVIERQCDYDGSTMTGFIACDGERYRPLNWTCHPAYGTVEVRMHESTMDPEEILSWVAYTQAIVEGSNRGELIDPGDSIDDTLSSIRIRREANPSKVRAKLRAKANR